MLWCEAYKTLLVLCCVSVIYFFFFLPFSWLFQLLQSILHRLIFLTTCIHSAILWVFFCCCFCFNFFFSSELLFFYTQIAFIHKNSILTTKTITIRVHKYIPIFIEEIMLLSSLRIRSTQHQAPSTKHRQWSTVHIGTQFTLNEICV